MLVFSGLEIKPYSQLTDLPRVRIDRVRVEVQRTCLARWSITLSAPTAMRARLTRSASRLPSCRTYGKRRKK